MDTLLDPRAYSTLLRVQITELSLASGGGQQFYYNNMTAYFDHLDMPLELWMFAPSLNNKISTKPNKEDEYYKTGDKDEAYAEYMDDLHRFNGAEENIIFDEFNIDTGAGVGNQYLMRETDERSWVVFSKLKQDNEWKLSPEFSKVGDLIGQPLKL